jgi:hypothetical protein
MHPDPRVQAVVEQAREAEMSIGAQKDPRIGVQQGPLCVGGKGLSR